MRLSFSILIVASLCMSLSLACHPSCNCDANSNICNTCVDPNSSLDPAKRSCPCNNGWYTAVIYPFKCEQFIQSTGSSGMGAILQMDACHIEIAKKTSQVFVKIQSKYSNIGSQANIVSDISLDFSSVSISQTCQGSYRTRLQYSSAGTYVDVPAQYVTPGSLGSMQVEIPLIDLYNLAETTTFNAQQISQLVKFQLFIGHSDKFVRVHRFTITVYTNRDEVNVFNSDIDLQRTSGCYPLSECIVVADLDTVQTVYYDAVSFVPRTSNLYEVGDMFVAKIAFADSSYTKKLTVQSILFKNDVGQIFDFTSLSTTSWTNNGLVVEFPLVEPTIGAIIQIYLKIDPISRLRSLAGSEEESSTTSARFTASILSGNATNTNTTLSEMPSSQSYNYSAFLRATAALLAAALLL